MTVPTHSFLEREAEQSWARHTQGLPSITMLFTSGKCTKQEPLGSPPTLSSLGGPRTQLLGCDHITLGNSESCDDAAPQGKTSRAANSVRSSGHHPLLLPHSSV